MRHLPRIMLLICFGFAALFASTAVHAKGILLCVEGIEGESQAKRPPNCMDVQSWSWEVTLPSASVGGTRTRASAQVGDLVVIKEVDKATPDLLLGILKGQVFPTAQLIVNTCPSGCAEPLPLVTISMENVLITRLEMGGTDETRPTESLSLIFEALEYCYQQIGQDGKAAGEICRPFSIETNA